MDHKASHLDERTVETIQRMEVILARARATARRAEERLRALLGNRLRGPPAEHGPHRRSRPPLP